MAARGSSSALTDGPMAKSLRETLSTRAAPGVPEPTLHGRYAPTAAGSMQPYNSYLNNSYLTRRVFAEVVSTKGRAVSNRVTKPPALLFVHSAIRARGAARKA